MRYVVVVKPPDDHPGSVRVFGPWRSIDEAGSFCEAVREEIYPVADISDETLGFAYVMSLEPARRRDAKRWALRGER